MKRHLSTFISISTLAHLSFALTATAGAATFVVDSSADLVDLNPGDGLCSTAAGECTLRAAIMEANAYPGADVIEIPAGTYGLTIPLPSSDPFYFDSDPAVGDLDITQDLTIRGAGSDATIVDASALGDRLPKCPSARRRSSSRSSG